MTLTDFSTMTSENQHLNITEQKFQELASAKNVIGVIILSNDGAPIKTSLDQQNTKCSMVRGPQTSASSQIGINGNTKKHRQPADNHPRHLAKLDQHNF